MRYALGRCALLFRDECSPLILANHVSFTASFAVQPEEIA
jgi:hypothetical protein